MLASGQAGAVINKLIEQKLRAVSCLVHKRAVRRAVERERQIRARRETGGGHAVGQHVGDVDGDARESQRDFGCGVIVE